LIGDTSLSMWKEYRRKIIKREEGNLTEVLRQDNYKNIILQPILWKRQLATLRNFMDQLKGYLQLITSS